MESTNGEHQLGVAQPALRQSGDETLEKSRGLVQKTPNRCQPTFR